MYDLILRTNLSSKDAIASLGDKGKDLNLDMRGDKLRKTLEALEDGALYFHDYLVAFFKAGYGASLGKLDYEFEKKRRKTEVALNEERLERENRRKFQKLIYKLKRDNLVEEKNEGDERVFNITQKGRNKLDELRQKKQKVMPRKYKKSKGVKIIIFIFDVPEKEKSKRNWLRGVLKELGFEMVQRSVWIGKIKIPKEFLEDIRKYMMIDYVEIFEISKTGSLKHII